MVKTDTLLKIFQEAAATVPAYKDLLRSYSVKPDNIKTLSDFRNEVPIIEKKSYIWEYPFMERVGKGGASIIYASSGSSGRPTLWVRGEDAEKLGGRVHDAIFRKVFQIDYKEPTLVVICFSMGIWIAGVYTLGACKYIASRNKDFYISTPGMETGDIFYVFRSLLPQFSNVILVGYTTFLMKIVEEARKDGMSFENVNMKILTAGDKFSETWRDEMLELCGISDPYHSLVSIYGSADAGPMAHETPTSIFLRRKAVDNQELFSELFGEALTLPALLQYRPDVIFFEEVNNELVLTTQTPIPLVRYNIHDVGRVIPQDRMRDIVAKYNLEEEMQRHGFSDWSLPFLAVKGRTDVAVTFYALNIYPENFEAAFRDRRLVNMLTGSYLVYTEAQSRNTDQKIHIVVELAEGIEPNNEMPQLIARVVCEHLEKLNIEFRKLYANIGNRALPAVRCVDYGSQLEIPEKREGFMALAGKKARML